MTMPNGKSLSDRLALAGVTAIVGETDESRIKSALLGWAGSRKCGSLSEEMAHLCSMPNVRRDWVLDAVRDVDGFRDSPEIIVTPFSQIRKQNVRWLWNQRILADQLNLIAGQGGSGKSTLMAHLTGLWTRGLPLPGETTGRDPIDVLMYLTEDNDYVVRQRLEAAGADLSRAHHLVGKGDPEDPIAISIDDIPRICEAVRQTNCEVLILDALKDFTRCQNDHLESQVREALSPLKRMARREEIAIIGVVHFGKSQGRSASDSVLGSVAWRDSARSVLAVNWLEGRSGPRGIGVAKCNNTDDPPVLVFDIESVGDVTRVVWDETPRPNLTADDLVPGPQVSAEDRSQLDSAKDFLREELANGPVPAKALRVAAEAACVSWRTVNRAKSDLGIMAKKEGYPGEWKWSLPQGCQTPSESAQAASLASFDDVTELCGNPDVAVPKDARGISLASLASLESQDGAE